MLFDLALNVITSVNHLACNYIFRFECSNLKFSLKTKLWQFEKSADRENTCLLHETILFNLQKITPSRYQF